MSLTSYILSNMALFMVAIFLVSSVAGAIASVSGFGIGSIMTPFFALKTDLKLAVAAVSIPHFVATAIRCWLLRKHIDKQIFLVFGIASAVGGLVGALFHNMAMDPVLTNIFAGLLMFAGITAMTGLSAKMRLPKNLGWLAGVLSGAFGGLVGNQGGIRSAALITYDLKRDAFVATATAIGLVVDLVRMPIYFYSESSKMMELWPWIAVGVAGAVIGTFFGKRVLSAIPEDWYRTIVGGLIFALGLHVAFAG